MNNLGRRTVLLGGAAVLGHGVLGGCCGVGATSQNRGAERKRSPNAADPESLTALAAKLNEAVSHQDAAAFAASFEPGLASTAAMLFGNAMNAAQWLAEAGADALFVRMRAGQEVGWGSAAVLPAFGSAGKVVQFRERAGVRPVVWLHQPVTVLHRGRIGLVAATTQAGQADQWLSATSDATARLAQFDFSAWRATAWDGSLVLELPADLLQFAEDASIGAYVVVRQPEDEPRIVCNPVARSGFDALKHRELMAHEAVHAITRSPGRAAPLWAIEGYAEHHAERAYPELAASNEAILRASSGTRLPTAAELNGGAADSYQRAALVVAAAQARWGERQVSAWFADWDRSDPPAPAVFADELSAALGRLRRVE